MFADPLIKKAIQSHPLVQRLGTIHSFVLNTAEQKCNLEIGLVGEPAPIRFSAKYKIEKTDSGADFCVFDHYWPDFTDRDLPDALAWYAKQDITLGG